MMADGGKRADGVWKENKARKPDSRWVLTEEVDTCRGGCALRRVMKVKIIGQSTKEIRRRTSRRGRMM